jgi:hypothetical protein
MIERRLSPLHIAAVPAVATFLLCAAAQGAENACGPATPAEEQVLSLRSENEILGFRVKQLEGVKTVTVERLRQKKAQRIREIAADVKVQRQSTSDFQGFVTWMSANLAGYNRYIQAGSYAAVIGRMLPIPYAGQASIFTKFVAQFTVALNAASVSLTRYLDSSQRFLAMADAIDPSRAPDDKAIAEAAVFADQKLLRDMNDAQARLSTVSELSSGALSFLESLNHYVGSTDEYWNKVKGLMKKDVDPKEKSFISESTSNLKAQADRFNGKLKTFGEITRKEATAVKALAVYDELAAELVAAQ